MFASIVHADPIVVMVDRSRDEGFGEVVSWLRPLRVFRSTDNRRRLTAARLRDYDLLAVCSTSAARYSVSECEAIKAFVKSGGSLVVAASAARFELDSGLNVDRLAAGQIAALFGYAFLSTRELCPNLHAHRGYSPDDLVLTKAGELLGVKLGDLLLYRPGPIAVPSGARALLRAKDGACIAATSRHGRGRVLVLGDAEMFARRYNIWSATHWLAKSAPQSRRSARRLKRDPDWRVPPVIPQSHDALSRGSVRVVFRPADRRRAKEVLGLAEDVWKETRRVMGPNEKLASWHITLHGGCRYWNEWPLSDPLRTFLGTSCHRAALIAALAEMLCDAWMIHRVGWAWRTFWQPMGFYLKHHLLRELGEQGYAAELEGACSGGDPVDLGRFYSDSRECGPQRRFWLDIERAWGPRTVRRIWKALPQKDPLEDLDARLYSGLDQIAFYLATVVGPRAYSWLRRQGHTVRRIPLRAPASDALKDALRREWARLLMNPSEPASDRYDALVLLGERLVAEKRPLERCAKDSRHASPRRALPAIARLLLVRDERGIIPARRFLRAADHGLASAVALLLAFETRDQQALEALVRRAGDQDVRFQLSAGYALECAADRRAGRFAFGRLRGCEMMTCYHGGMKKVFPLVDGYAVANTWNIPHFFDMPYQTAFSTWYVDWVHTSPRWRRRGLARLAMGTCLDEHHDRECASTSLHTGTRNPAHTLYREFGLQDVWVMHELKRDLASEALIRAPRGIRIRAARLTDMPAVTELLMKRRHDKIMMPVRLTRWPELGPAFVAIEGKRLVGVTSAHLRLKEAHLEFIEVDEFKSEKPVSKRVRTEANRREEIGLALLNRLHRALHRKGQKRIEKAVYGSLFDDFLFGLVRHAGYATKRGGNVELHRINDLAQLLDELKAMFEERLQGNKTWRGWTGAIDLEGDDLCARMRFSQGRLTVSDPRRARDHRGRRPSSPALVLRGGRQSITGVVFGYASPYEEHLQIGLETIPSPNASVTSLIETLFPRSVRE